MVEEKSFEDISYLELWPPFFSAEQNFLCYFRRGHHEEQVREFISNLGQWFRRRCCLKDFLSGALATLQFSKVEPFMQFWKRASWGTFMWSYMKFGLVVQEEMPFKEKVLYTNGQTMTDHNSSPRAFCKAAGCIPSIGLIIRDASWYLLLLHC